MPEQRRNICTVHLIWHTCCPTLVLSFCQFVHFAVSSHWNSPNVRVKDTLGHAVFMSSMPAPLSSMKSGIDAHPEPLPHWKPFSLPEDGPVDPSLPRFPFLVLDIKHQTIPSPVRSSASIPNSLDADSYPVWVLCLVCGQGGTVDKVLGLQGSSLWNQLTEQ